MLSIDAVTTAGEFSSLAPSWNDLLSASPRRSLYLTHEWLTSWWSTHAAPGMELCVLIARDEQGIAGLAPLVTLTRRYLGVPVRLIEFLSMSMYADHPASVTGSLDWVIRREPEGVLGAFFDYIVRRKDTWQGLRLHPVPSDSPYLSLAVRESSRRGLTALRRTVLDDAVIGCAGGWDRFYGSLTGDFRRTLRRRSERLAALGGVAYRRIDGMEIGSMFERLLDIEKRSWKWERGVSLNSAATGSFFREFVRKAASRGWLRTWVLTLRDEDIAYELCISFDGDLHCLKKSYDMRYRDSFPGGLLERHIYEEAFRAGVNRIHTLWGDAEHKLRWRSVLEPHDELLVFHDGSSSRRVRSFLIGAQATRIHREMAEGAKRALRWVGLHPRFSELTRMDQL